MKHSLPAFRLKPLIGLLLQVLVVGLLSAGCGSGKDKAEKTAPVDLRPDWIRTRPLKSGVYLAIGSSPKRSGVDHVGNARTQALNDIAAQISIEVSGNSLLHQLETNDRYREDFQSTVRSSTMARLEGYELTDQYETETEYWALYELNKETHRILSEKRRAKAVANALDLRARAKTELERGEDLLALNTYIRSMEAVSEFWAQSVEAEVDGRTVFLSNQLYAEFGQAVANIKIRPLPPRIELIRGLPLSNTDLAFVVENGQGRVLAQAPVFLHYSGDVLLDREVMSGSDGRVHMGLNRVQGKKPRETLTATFNLVALARLSSSSTTALIANSVRPSEAVMQLDIVEPKVAVEGVEMAEGISRTPPRLQKNFERLFVQRGSTLVSANKADLRLRYTATASRTHQSAGTTVGYTVQLEAELYDRNGQLIHSRKLGEVVGQHLEADKAIERAFERMGEEIDRRYFRDLLRSAGID